MTDGPDAAREQTVATIRKALTIVEAAYGQRAALLVAEAIVETCGEYVRTAACRRADERLAALPIGGSA
jgi:hypothetical protein